MKTLLETVALIPELIKVQYGNSMFFIVRTGINCADVVSSTNGVIGAIELHEVYKDAHGQNLYTGIFWPADCMNIKEIQFECSTLRGVIKLIFV